MRRGLSLLVFAITIGYAQDHASPDPGTKVTPADLNISCNVDEVTRTAAVTVVNRTNSRFYFLRSGPAVDYAVTATDADGKRLAKAAPSWANETTSKLKPRSYSTAMIVLDAGTGYSATFPLSDLVLLPRQGGKFEIRAGQVLFYLNSDPLQPDPAKIAWCSHLQVTFPPLE